MHRKTSLFVWPLVCVLTGASCSGTPQTMVSPSATPGATAFDTAGTLNVKIGAPTGLSPNGATLDTRRPTLSFINPTLRFAGTGVPLRYEIEVQGEAGNVIYSTVVDQSPGTTSHTPPTDAPFATTLWWRARALVTDQGGPWSDFAQFRTPDPPPPPGPPAPIPVPGGGLPFPVPAACGPFGPDNRFACAAAVAALSIEWQGCAGGRGVSCHRFSRQVVFALAQSDSNWKMIVAAPGGNACNCSGCGPSDGTMFREDTTVYGGNRVFDMIVGAGGPTPSLTWSPVPGPRPGDLPNDAPLCVP